MPIPRTLLPALATALALPAAPHGPPAARFEIADGPVAKAVAGVGPETAPVALAGLFGEERAWLLAPLADGAAEMPLASWAAWGRWLAAARAGGADRAAQLGLGLIALRDGRWEDAWRVVAKAGGDPREVAALVPHLLPGAPLDRPAAAGGMPPALPEGVILRPAPPPLPERVGPGLARPDATFPRRAAVSGFQVGDAQVALEVGVEPSGVQVTLTHLAGGRTRFAVLLPQVEGQEIRVEYVDWMRQDARHAPLAVELAPGGEPVVLFARFLPREPEFPASPEGALPPTLEAGGIWIEVEGEGEELALPRAAAEAFGVALGVPAGLRRPLEPPPAGPFAGIVLRYARGDAGERLLDGVASAAEAYLLR